MSRHLRARPRRGLRTAVVAVVAGAGLLLGTDGSLALFSDTATVTTPASTAGSISEPGRPTLSQTVGTGDGAVSWSSVAVGLGNATAYDIVRYPSATGGTGTVVCTNVAALSCTEPKPDSAASNTTYYYAVRARFATNWVREAAARTAYTPDVIIPTGTISTPINTTTRCGSNEAACGTAADSGGGSVARIEYALTRTMTRNQVVQATDCWDGSAWSTAAGGSCTTFYRGTGTTDWAVPGRRTTVYASPPSGRTYTWSLVLKLVDTYENTRTSQPITASS